VTVGVAVAVAIPVALAALHATPGAARAGRPSGPTAERAAARLLTKASGIAAALDRAGDWGEAITEEEANAWLALDLPRLAAGRLPGWSRSLAVRFHPRRVALSGAIGRGPASARWWTILAVALEGGNRLVFEVESSGLGLVPLPPGVVLSAIASAASARGCRAEIGLLEGRPRLNVTLPGRSEGAPTDGSEYHLEGLRIDEGELVIAGSTRGPRDGKTRSRPKSPTEHP